MAGTNLVPAQGHGDLSTHYLDSMELHPYPGRPDSADLLEAAFAVDDAAGDVSEDKVVCVVEVAVDGDDDDDDVDDCSAARVMSASTSAWIKY